MEYYAHSRNQQGQRQSMEEHLRCVAEMASRFAAAFGADDLAAYLGWWHDLGKFNPEFQAYLLRCEANPTAGGHGPDHKAAGTLIAGKHFSMAALLIQGHHGGLKAPSTVQGWLEKHQSDPAVAEALRLARQALPAFEPAEPFFIPSHVRHDPVQAEFFLRMLFSALIDADRLDTERHFNPDIASQRGAGATMQDLWERFEHDQRRFATDKTGPVNDARRAIYDACIAAADLPPGLFKLAVPTGGGKTRSAMAFALRHALRNDLRRIVIAVPFISITEQTAKIYRGIFESRFDGAPVVLEHHSGTSDRAPDDGDAHPRSVWTRLASENWDAPIVVTTTVQLFESLFANGTSRVRKIHRLARSVIVLDEAQSLPPHLLTPILDALRQLCTHYGATVVISTATQPAFETIPAFASVLATDIIPNSERYYTALHRVEYAWHTEQPLEWSEVAHIMRSEPSALAILNTKKDALALLDALDDPNALHLSTLLCGAHRRAVIEEVKRRLKAGEPCYLVSTQVVEAGVDLDFPLVLRALGPLDGIIQAAGRCNREGKLPSGRVVVFRPAEGGMPLGAYQTATQITGALLGAGPLDPDDPTTSRTYFQRLFHTLDPDRDDIQGAQKRFDYPETDQRFRMIKDDTESVVVPYGSEKEQKEVQRILAQLRNGSPRIRLLLRRLQPYVVSLYTKDAQYCRRQGWIQPVFDEFGEWSGAYDAVRGLSAKDRSLDNLVV